MIKGATGLELEIEVQLQMGDTGEIGLDLCRSDDGKRSIPIRFDGKTLDVAGSKAPLEVSGLSKSLELHVFLDRTLIEVFANDGRVCVTRVIDPPATDRGVALFSTSKGAKLEKLEAWKLRSIW